MKKFYKMSDSEMEIMEVIWGLEPPVVISQLLSIFETKKWKIQTMATFLTRLVDKGLLNVEKRTKANHYSPAITKKKYEQLEALNVLESMYCGSLRNFLSALYNEGEISVKTIKELKDWLKKAGG